LQYCIAEQYLLQYYEASNNIAILFFAILLDGPLPNGGQMVTEDALLGIQLDGSHSITHEQEKSKHILILRLIDTYAIFEPPSMCVTCTSGSVAISIFFYF